jgi:FKBP-type peptidyl-prolyl cis-trans isomerase
MASQPPQKPQQQSQQQSNTSDNVKESTLVFTDKFKKAVIEYCEKDDKRMKLQKELRDVRKELKDLEEDIVKFMETNNLPIFDTGEKGLFKNTTQKKTKNLNKTLLIDALSKCGQLKDPKKADQVVDFIYKSRPTENVKVLSRKN